MHDALRHLLFNTYDYRDNRGVIMMITMMTFFIITQHYSADMMVVRWCRDDQDPRRHMMAECSSKKNSDCI